MGGRLKTAPVVKSARDREALWEALADGTLDLVATDHAPGKWPEEKATGSIWTDYGGVPGVELMLPFLMSEGVCKGRLSLARALALLCTGPARVHQLLDKGSLQAGADGDVVVFDPHTEWEVRASELQTRQRYTPFEGWRFRGRVEATWVRGVLVHDRERGPIGEPSGRLVPCA
jgi:dihydroorotase-like cyclic amidohydrolase